MCRSSAARAPGSGGEAAALQGCGGQIEEGAEEEEENECKECGARTRDGWRGDRAYKGVWFCRACWEAWQDSQRGQLPAPEASPPKVFVLGLPKCGTTSLQHALESAGYHAVHCYAPKPWRTWEDPADRFVGNLMAKAVEHGRPPLAFLPSWVNAVTQLDCWWYDNSEAASASTARAIFPQISMLRELDSAYPGAKFILNLRDPHSWVRSVDKYYHLRQILVEADLPGLPPGVGGRDDELVDWFNEHTARVRENFAGREGEALLEIALEDGNEKIHESLQRFLGRPLEWGHHNATTWA